MEVNIDLKDEQMVLIIRDMILPLSIGIREREKRVRQRVRINVRVIVPYTASDNDNDIDSYVSYSPFVEGIRALSQQEHINLLETLAEEIASVCFKDVRVQKVFVEVEKIDIYGDVGGIGVLLTQTKRGNREVDC